MLRVGTRGPGDPVARAAPARPRPRSVACSQRGTNLRPPAPATDAGAGRPAGRRRSRPGSGRARPASQTSPMPSSGGASGRSLSASRRAGARQAPSVGIADGRADGAGRSRRSPCGVPAAATCRWTRPTRRTGRRYMLDDAGAGASSSTTRRGRPAVDEQLEAARPPATRDRTTWPTSSTPPARPGAQGGEVEHRSLANLLQAMADQPGFDGRRHVAAVTTFSFDIAVLELCLPLITGGCWWSWTGRPPRTRSRLAAALERLRRHDVCRPRRRPGGCCSPTRWPGRPGPARRCAAARR